MMISGTLVSSIINKAIRRGKKREEKSTNPKESCLGRESFDSFLPFAHRRGNAVASPLHSSRAPALFENHVSMLIEG